MALVGELDMDSAPKLRLALDPLIADGPEEIILNLSALTFIDSSGIAALVMAQKDLVAMGRRLSVRSPRANVIRVLEITGLAEFLGVELAEDTRAPG